MTWRRDGPSLSLVITDDQGVDDAALREDGVCVRRYADPAETVAPGADVAIGACEPPTSI